jgi:hypothetical protein
MQPPIPIVTPMYPATLVVKKVITLLTALIKRMANQMQVTINQL